MQSFSMIMKIIDMGKSKIAPKNEKTNGEINIQNKIAWSNGQCRENWKLPTGDLMEEEEEREGDVDKERCGLEERRRGLGE